MRPEHHLIFHTIAVSRHYIRLRDAGREKGMSTLNHYLTIIWIPEYVGQEMNIHVDIYK